MYNMYVLTRSKKEYMKNNAKNRCQHMFQLIYNRLTVNWGVKIFMPPKYVCSVC